MSRSLVWSSYQSAVFDHVVDGSGNLVVVARAGSAKTTTTVEAIKRVPKAERTCAMAFNKSVAQHLQTVVPPTCDARSFHSYGYSVVCKHFRGVEVDQDRTRGLIEKLGLSIDREDAPAFCQLVSIAKNVLADSEKELVDLAEEYGVDWTGYSAEEAAPLALQLLEASRTVDESIDYDDMIWLPYVHVLPRFQFDRLFIDEAQDINPAQVEIGFSALREGGRLTTIGDDRQCHPPGVLVEVALGQSVPIESLSDADRVRSWNRNAQVMVGGRSIRIASRRYSGKLFTVTSNHRSVPVTPNHRMLCRWVDRESKVCVSYLMWRSGFGFRVGWCQLFNKGGMFHLGHRARIEGAERTWILRVHESRTEASVYESIVAARYGIPTATFEPVHGAEHLVESSIRQIFSAVSDENFERGCRVLVDHNREFDLWLYPWIGKNPRDHQGRRTYFQTFASNVIPGLMMVPLPEGRNTWSSIDAVSVSEYEGDVYSLDVEEDHSYAANGIVVLNSIYGWRGASPELLEIEGATRLPLPICYRCGKNIVALAQRIVPDIQAWSEAPEGVVSTLEYAKLGDRVEPGDFVLSRTNAPLLGCWLSLVKSRIPSVILGREAAQPLLRLIRRSDAGSVADLLEYAEGWHEREAKRLAKRGKPTQAIDDRLECLRVICESLPGETSVRRAVDLVHRMFAAPSGECVTLSTTHKAKGLERRRAFLLGWTYCRWEGPEERNLLYVATTRAQQELVIVSEKPGGTERERLFGRMNGGA